MDETIEVVGTGAAAAPPDAARLTFRVQADEADEADVATVMQTLTARSGAVSEVVRGLGVEDRDIRTTGLTLHQTRDASGMPTGGFTASHQLVVLAWDLSRAGDLIDAAIRAAGEGLQLDDLRLELYDDESLQSQARLAAYSDAESKARELARLAGVGLGHVLRIVEESPGHLPRPVAFAKAAFPVEPGEQTVTVALRVSFALARV